MKKATPTVQHNPWLFNGEYVEEAPEGYAGYVYKISYFGNKCPQTTYIGSKLFNRKTSRLAPKKLQLTKKGLPKKNPVRIRGSKQSDWLSYFGSCIPLKELVAIEPPHLFRREILAFGVTKQQVLYLEHKMLYCEGVLENDHFFNNWIGGCKIFRWQAKAEPAPKRKLLGNEQAA